MRVQSVFSCTEDGPHTLHRSSLVPRPCPKVFGQGLRIRLTKVIVLLVSTYPRSPFPAHRCGVSESTVCSPLCRTTTLTGRWAVKIRTYTHNAQTDLCIIMVTMTTVSKVICHTHLIAMLYYCGYFLQAGEIGRGH